MLIAILAVVLTLLAGGTWLLVRYNASWRVLARAQLAMQAGDYPEALRLARQYVAQRPNELAGHLIEGQAGNHLGHYDEAREALRRAVLLKPEEPAAYMALAESYLLPVVNSQEGMPDSVRLESLQGNIDNLMKAEQVLRTSKVVLPEKLVPLRRLAASSVMYRGRILQMVVNKKLQEARVAEAGRALEQAQRLKKDSQLLAEQSGRLEQQAFEEFKNVIQDVQSTLPGMKDGAKREGLRLEGDRAARHLVDLCTTSRQAELWPKARSLVDGLAEISPVAVMQAAMFDAPRAAEATEAVRRQALQAIRRRAEELLEHARTVGDKRDLRLGLARMAIGLRDYASAQRLCDEVLQANPNQPLGRLMRAQLYVNAGKYAEAERLLFVLRTNYPYSSEILLAYALAVQGVGKPELAEEAMQTLTELNPREVAAWRFVIERQLDKGFSQQAFSRAKDFYYACPAEPESLRMLVTAALAAQQQEYALGVLEQARGQHEPQFLVAAAESFAALGDNKRCQALARQAAGLQPRSANQRLAVARAKQLAGESDQAEAAILHEIQESPNLAAAHYQLARLYSETDRPLQAIDQLKVALALDPLDRSYRLTLAEKLLAEGYLEPCRQVLAPLPEDYLQARLLRFQVQAMLGEPIDKEGVLARAGDQRNAALSVAIAFLRSGRPDECLEIAMARLKDDPSRDDMRLLAGHAHLMLDHAQECLEIWRQILERSPNRLDIHVLLADVLARRLPVMQVGQGLAKMGGTRADLSQLATGWLYERRGELEQALNVYKKLADDAAASEEVRQRSCALAAQTLAALGRTGEALQTLRPLEALAQWKQATLTARADIYAAASSPQAANALEELRAQARSGRDASMWMHIVDLDVRLRMLDKALADCDALLEIPGHAHEGYMRKGAIQESVAQWDQARESYRNAVAALATDVDARKGLARCLDQLGRPEEALAIFQEMQALGPAQEAEGLLAKAEMLQGWGLLDQAVECLQAIDKLGFGSDGKVQLALGRALGRLGEKERARTVLRELPIHSQQYIEAGLTLADLADTQPEAMAVLDKLQGLFPDNDAVLERVLRLHVQANETAKAASIFHAFAQERRGGRTLPEAASFLAYQALLAEGNDRDAWTLAVRMSVQTRRPFWRRLVALAEPADAPLAPQKDFEMLDILLRLVNSARRQDWQSVAAADAELQKVCANSPGDCPGGYRVLAALIADSRQQNVDLRRLALNEPAGLVLELGNRLQLAGDRQIVRLQAASLLRSALAADLGVKALAYRLCMDLLKQDPSCQWAALLASFARGEDSGKEILPLLKGDGVACRLIQGDDCLRRQRPGEAAQAYAQAAQQAGNDCQLRLRQADALRRCGRSAEALEIYARIRLSSSGALAAIAANNAADIMAELYPADRVRLAQAYEWSSSAVAAQGGVSEFHDTKGKLAMLLGRTDEARSELRLALRGMVTSSELHKRLAEVERAAGNQDLARWHRQAAERLTRRDASASIQPGAPVVAGASVAGVTWH